MIDTFVRAKLRCQKGAVAVSVAVLMVAMVGFAAMAIDVGYLMATRNELQNVADAAALAAARQLGANYQTMLTADEQQNYNCSTSGTFPCSQIIQVAKDAGADNRAGQINITIGDSDVEIGYWNPSGSPQFTTGTSMPTAVRVTARRDGVLNNPITTFLAGVVGVDELAVIADATASLTPQGEVNEGDLELPVGISKAWFDLNLCGQPIRFSPANSPDSCAGWTSWEYNSNDATLRNILDRDNPLLSPGLESGDPINFIGGSLSNPTFDALKELFQDRGYDVKMLNGEWVPVTDASGETITGALDHSTYPETDPICEKLHGDTDAFYSCSDGIHTTPLLYPDGTPQNRHHWETKVVVYESNTCENPNQSYGIAGFAKVTVTEVVDAPEKSIVGTVTCGLVDIETTRGGGGSYGTFGSVPQLVE